MRQNKKGDSFASEPGSLLAICGTAASGLLLSPLMRLLLVFASLCLLIADVSRAQNEFQRELGAKVAELEKANASAIAGRDGWLFLISELRFLAQGRFWGDAAAKTARSSKSPDPLPAIVDFDRQLKARGIQLVLLPVPPKATVYADKLEVEPPATPTAAAPQLQEFYGELRGAGVNVLDLTSTFIEKRNDARGPVFCRTDSHWSGVGTVVAAELIAQQIRSSLPTDLPRKDHTAEWKEISLTGDLISLLPAGAPKPEPEKLPIRTITEKSGAGAVQPDSSSPVLVMGDSHTLVFREFLGERAGLVDQLAHELGFAPDLIGTRGSGATAVRVTLYRRSRTDSNFLAKKKVIIWCFAAREFTEADQGWVPQPVAK